VSGGIKSTGFKTKDLFVEVLGIIEVGNGVLILRVPLELLLAKGMRKVNFLIVHAAQRMSHQPAPGFAVSPLMS
jgi:hypothetical protein